MGWLSSSSPSPQAAEKASHLSQPPLSEPPPSTPDIADARPTPTRDDIANAELRAFLESLQPEPSPPASSPNAQPPSQKASSLSADSTLLTPTHLYPSSISCRAAFDTAFYCQSLGGQFNNLYRYGGMRSCSEQWSQFWFCMRTNRGYMGEEERERRVREHYRQRETKYRVGPSSEDVWRQRERRVEGAFEGDMVKAEEAERRWREREEGEGR